MIHTGNKPVKTYLHKLFNLSRFIFLPLQSLRSDFIHKNEYNKHNPFGLLWRLSELTYVQGPMVPGPEQALNKCSPSLPPQSPRSFWLSNITDSLILMPGLAEEQNKEEFNSSFPSEDLDFIESPKGE